MEEPPLCPDLRRFEVAIVVTPRFNLGPAAARYLRLPYLRDVLVKSGRAIAGCTAAASSSQALLEGCLQ